MATEEQHTISKLSEHLQNIIDCFVKSKTEYIRDKDECARLRETNTRLELEVQELRELEKSHRYHLSTSREIISSLQESVSNLVPFKRNIKKLTSELEASHKANSVMEEDTRKLQTQHVAEMQALMNRFQEQIEQISRENDAKLRSMESEHDTQITLHTCDIAELKSKIAELEAEHKEKINMIVLEYEERLQRCHAQLTQLHDQHAGLVARTDTNCDVYRRRIEELEEKLKQNEYKHFMAKNSVVSPAQKPYTSYPASYVDQDIVDMDNELQKTSKPGCSQNKTNVRGFNPLHVVQIPSTTKLEKKGFSILKKRKLYSDKDFN